MKSLGIPLHKVPLVVRSLRKGVHAASPNLHPTDGMRGAIIALRDGGYRLGVVTSNSKENVLTFLEKNDMLGCFDFIRAGVGVFSKGLAVRRTIANEGIENAGTVFVGDEIRDIDAAKKNGITAIGVTWGINSRDGLASAQPDFIVDTAEELLALFGVVLPAEIISAGSQDSMLR
jgi:phosphoglycolate phosphatase-like HAD superfamily hydrolase